MVDLGQAIAQAYAHYLETPPKSTYDLWTASSVTFTEIYLNHVKSTGLLTYSHTRSTIGDYIPHLIPSKDHVPAFIEFLNEKMSPIRVYLSEENGEEYITLTSTLPPRYTASGGPGADVKGMAFEWTASEYTKRAIQDIAKTLHRHKDVGDQTPSTKDDDVSNAPSSTEPDQLSKGMTFEFVEFEPSSDVCEYINAWCRYLNQNKAEAHKVDVKSSASDQVRDPNFSDTNMEYIKTTFIQTKPTPKTPQGLYKNNAHPTYEPLEGFEEALGAAGTLFRYQHKSVNVRDIWESTIEYMSRVICEYVRVRGNRISGKFHFTKDNQPRLFMTFSSLFTREMFAEKATKDLSCESLGILSYHTEWPSSGDEDIGIHIYVGGNNHHLVYPGRAVVQYKDTCFYTSDLV